MAMSLRRQNPASAHSFFNSPQDVIHPLPAEGGSGAGRAAARLSVPLGDHLPGFLPPAPQLENSSGSVTHRQTPRTARDVEVVVHREAIASSSVPVGEAREISAHGELRPLLAPGQWPSINARCPAGGVGELAAVTVCRPGADEDGEREGRWRGGAPIAEGVEDDEGERRRLLPNDDADRAGNDLPLLLNPLQALRARLCDMVYSPIFQTVIAVTIIANTVCLSLVHYPMTSTFSDVLETANLTFLVAFTLEAVLKIAGLGLRTYLRDRFNVFDLLVVSTSYVEVLVDALTNYDFPGLTMLRAMRLLRILKLIQHWSSLSSLAVVVLKGLSSLTSFLVVLLIFIFTFALLGMQVRPPRSVHRSPHLDSHGGGEACSG